MKGKGKRSILALVAMVVLFVATLATSEYWLSGVINFLLPKGVTLTFAQRPQWQKTGLLINSVKLQVNQCTLATSEDVHLALRHFQWQLSADKLAIDSGCFSQWPLSTKATSPPNLTQLQSKLPTAQLSVANFSLLGLGLPASKLVINLSKHQQEFQLINSLLHASLHLSGQSLAIKKLSYRSLPTQTELSIQGRMTLSNSLTALPESGDLLAELTDNRLSEPVVATMNFTDTQGLLKLTSTTTQSPLVEFPWIWQGDALAVIAGKWSWPFATRPMHGSVTFRLNDCGNLWQQGPVFSARVNLLTEGQGGKGNLVVSAGPGRLTWQNNALPLQLNGVLKALKFQIYTAIPALLTGALESPSVQFRPGALLRARGEILPDWIVDEARFPLAGVKFDQHGISGPLQGNFKVRNQYQSFYLLHLAGQAHSFLLNSGRWDWRYWGKGKLLPLQANWDIAGRGYWQDKTIKLTELTTGFNQLRFHAIRVTRPRLELLKPIQWSFDKTNSNFSGALQFTMSTAHLGPSSQLPPAQLKFELKGKTPSQFGWQAILLTDKIGPIRFIGRRDNDDWLGRGNWPEQALTVIQPLIGDKNTLAVRQGTINGAIAFSIRPDVGLQLGGHWRVKNGELWTPKNRYRAIQFSLPYRYRQGQWQFGPKAPVDLFIGQIENQTTISNVHAELQGFYPFTELKPLRLVQVNLNLLGGRVHLAEFRLPQQQAAKLEFSNIDLSQLISLLHPSQFAMSGHINAELPIWLSRNSWKISHGWFSNAGDVTLRMDKELIDRLIRNNLVAGVALDWLRYMEINKLQALADVNSKGLLKLTARVAGTSEFSHNRQRVRLNYTHQQNILTLWQSLSFTNNLESWLTENVKLPEKEGKQN